MSDPFDASLFWFSTWRMYTGLDVDGYCGISDETG